MPCIFSPSFYSLQTGRTSRTCRIYRGEHQWENGFYSLQTGRTSRTFTMFSISFAISKFLFPSNGKDFQNVNDTRLAQQLNTSVFLFPFKREGLPEHLITPDLSGMDLFLFPSKGKDFQNSNDIDRIAAGIRFLFPSNGKDFQNLWSLYAAPPPSGCFYSLQTGRTSRTKFCIKERIGTQLVSIPFKREGLPEPIAIGKGSDAITCFYSLQTGRTSRTIVAVIVCVATPVSIPFKREGLPEHTLNNNTNNRVFMFLFPSNGKDFQNLRPERHTSGPKKTGFYSLQTGRTSRTFLTILTIVAALTTSFYSLQTGRTSRTREDGELLWSPPGQFLFPSNGKDFQNLLPSAKAVMPSLVSIPFKREGLPERPC